MKKLFGPLVLGVFLSLGIVLSPGYLFANENLYSESEIANLDENLQSLTNKELQDLSEDLISEKEAIEQRIEEGEIESAQLAVLKAWFKFLLTHNHFSCNYAGKCAKLFNLFSGRGGDWMSFT